MVRPRARRSLASPAVSDARRNPPTTWSRRIVTVHQHLEPRHRPAARLQHHEPSNPHKCYATSVQRKHNLQQLQQGSQHGCRLRVHAHEHATFCFAANPVAVSRTSRHHQQARYPPFLCVQHRHAVAHHAHCAPPHASSRSSPRFAMRHRRTSRASSRSPLRSATSEMPSLVETPLPRCGITDLEPRQHHY